MSAFSSPPSSQKFRAFSLGKARYRQLQGKAELANAFLRRAEAAERLAAGLEDKAFALRLEADALVAADDRSRDWREVLHVLAA